MNSLSTSSALCADLRSMDPVAYITAIGLQPEDSYGFVPVEHSDGSALLYIYRDRAGYAEARAGLAAPQRSRLLGGLVEVDRPGGIEIDLGAFSPALAAPAMSLVMPEPTPSAEPSAPIASQRVYPGLRVRSSGKQLNHFLPRYAEVVGVRAEDVYGVFARGIHMSGGESSAREWQSMWLVYRDRPEYAPGRERWAQEMASKGGWPQSELTGGSITPPPARSAAARVEVRREGWPKRKLMVRETGDGLGPRLIEEIRKLGYPPERAFGICPDFQQRKLYYALGRP